MPRGTRQLLRQLRADVGDEREANKLVKEWLLADLAQYWAQKERPPEAPA
jgi:hypothetical protein